jgi:hypothetical protein
MNEYEMFCLFVNHFQMQILRESIHYAEVNPRIFGGRGMVTGLRNWWNLTEDWQLG